MTFSRIHVGDSLAVLKTLPTASVQCCVTSPPYWGLRDYGVEGQMGLESTPQEFLAGMVAVFDEVRRVLRDDGVCWVNMGDGYAAGHGGSTTEGNYTPKVTRHRKAQPKVRDDLPNAPSAWAERDATPKRITAGLKPKDLIGMPWRLAFALQDAGWWLRSDCIWAKPNPMPESVTDRPTKAHEYVFLLTKSARYYYDADAVRETSVGVWNSASGFGTDGKKSAGDPMLRTQGAGTFHADVDQTGRNLRTVWTIPTQPYAEAHFATFPEALPDRCIRAGTSEKGCCAKCGMPWGRVTERESNFGERPETTGAAKKAALGEMARTTPQGRTCGTPTVETLGWVPVCECNTDNPVGAGFQKDVVPCTVLDPFAGSGATGAVAAKLGRSFIGIELNPAYAELARKRIGKAMPLFVRPEVIR